jgi:moderate conductance mechanosensitive channel
METNTPSIITRALQQTGAAGLWDRTSPEVHILFIIVLAFLVHLAVRIIRQISEWSINESHAKKNPFTFVTQQPKFITLTRLIVSGLIFMIYFIAIGFVLVHGFRVNVNAYLASASIIGFAISFGSQSLAQDIVTGVTLIFSNVIDVGDIVDLSGTVGRVERIGLRFTRLVNFSNQEINVPNRNIGNVSRFPHGGVHAFVDIQIPTPAEAEKVVPILERITKAMWSQFGATILKEPLVGKIESPESGAWNFLRIEFKIWPGQVSLIETTFRQQITAALKSFDPNYADWMVTVTYRTIQRNGSDTPTGLNIEPKMCEH